MTRASAQPTLNPGETAARLGVSAKALRLYENRGLLSPQRTAAGWRVYGPEAVARAAEIVALRALGLSLSQIAGVLNGQAQDLVAALENHQSNLEIEAAKLARSIAATSALLARLHAGETPSIAHCLNLPPRKKTIQAVFALPWPWGGERFELSTMGPLNFLTGPLGSGKTRFAQYLADELPNTDFIGLDRQDDPVRRLSNPSLDAHIQQATDWLIGDGATASPALAAILFELETKADRCLVFDYIDQGLDHATQEALVAYLRAKKRPAPVVLMTRSTAILDLEALSPGETVLLCPANHGMPMQLTPVRGTPGYITLASCLATPEVRARGKRVTDSPFTV